MTGTRELKIARPLVFIDFETTGLSTTTDRIVELTVLKLFPDGSEEERVKRLNPGIPIQPGATEIHGITDADVADMPSFAQYAKSLSDFLDGCDIGGFNVIRFDVPLLIAEFRRVGMAFDLEGRKVVDSQVIFHAFEPRDLVAAYQKYCGKTLDNAHSSTADVRAASEVFRAQVSYYPELPVEMAGLHDFCHPKQPDWIDDDGRLVLTTDGAVLGFGKYRGRSLKEIALLEPSYLHWVISQDFSDQVKSILIAVLRDPGHVFDWESPAHDESPF